LQLPQISQSNNSRSSWIRRSGLALRFREGWDQSERWIRYDYSRMPRQGVQRKRKLWRSFEFRKLFSLHVSTNWQNGDAEIELWYSHFNQRNQWLSMIQ